MGTLVHDSGYRYSAIRECFQTQNLRFDDSRTICRPGNVPAARDPFEPIPTQSSSTSDGDSKVDQASVRWGPQPSSVRRDAPESPGHNSQSAFIDAEKAQYPIVKMCTWLEVSTSGFCD